MKAEKGQKLDIQVIDRVSQNLVLLFRQLPEACLAISVVMFISFLLAAVWTVSPVISIVTLVLFLLFAIIAMWLVYRSRRKSPVTIIPLNNRP